MMREKLLVALFVTPKVVCIAVCCMFAPILFSQQVLSEVAPVAVLSDADLQLPDSVYTYLGKNRILCGGAAVRYDEAGRIVLEEGWLDRNGDDVLDENDQPYRIKWTYTETDGLLYMEKIQEKQQPDGQWKGDSRIVQTTPILYPDVFTEYLDYMMIDDEWQLYARTVATEYNENGLPVVRMDTLFDFTSFTAITDEPKVVEVVRQEITYNADLQPEVILELISDEATDEWILNRRKEYFYESGKLVKDTYAYPTNDGDLAYLYEQVYAYDEHGNMISQIKQSNNLTSETFYEYVYLSDDNANAPVAEQDRQMHVALADGKLTVLSMSETLFHVAVYNLQGQLTTQQRNLRNGASLSLQGAPKGVYMVHITSVSGERLCARKIVLR